MTLFICCVALLIGAYFTYGVVVERIFGIKPNRPTPAHTLADGVDYMVLPKWKIWLIQLLNIAGTGPIFGPILGALYGPVAMLWIVIGCIFAGAVHDYFCGMISIRNGGASIPQMASRYIGKPIRLVIEIFALLLLVLVGAVFVTSPAGLMAQITETVIGKGVAGTAQITTVWAVIIFAYYVVATLLPIDKIIGKIYPIFGALLMFMTFGIMGALLLEGDARPLFRSVGLADGLSIGDFFRNFNPNPNMPIWPLIFITISCGALSGFHATQTPLMARCSDNEREGRFIFYGAMITEGIIALIWCMVGLSFYDDVQALQAAIKAGTPSKVVYDAATTMLGTFGGVLAVLGVVVLPITSGDTAFRAARLQLSEFLRLDQRPMVNRLIIAVPLFAIGGWLTTIDFTVLWRYFNWANQTTATIMLWIASAYLYRHRKFHWVCTVPALLMSQVVLMNLFWDGKLGFGLDYGLSAAAAVAITALMLFGLLRGLKPKAGEDWSSD